MTINEMLETLREGKAVACDDRLYMKIENGRFVERSQESGGVVIASSCVLIPIDDVLKNETDYRIYEKPVLNDVEKKYLSEVLRPFKKSFAKIVISKSDNFCISKDKERLLFMLTNIDGCYEEMFSLPNFAKGTMYKGMKTNKNYSLEELGL